MKKIIITKIDGVSNKKYINDKNNYNYYETENIIELLNFQKYDIDKKYINIANNFIRDIFIKYKFKNKLNNILYIINSNESDIEILKLYEYTIKNYNKIVKNFPKKRKEDIYEALNICFNTDKEIIIKIIAKELINIYIKNILLNLPNEKLNKIFLTNLRNEDINVILNELGITNNKKYSVLLEKAVIKKINSIYEKKFPHLCWEHCKNIDNCDKIDDVLTELITRYDFIKSGYQILKPKINEKNEIQYTTDKFYVTDCENYVKKLTRNNKNY